MRILWLAFISIAASQVQGYGASWYGHEFPRVPSTQRPIYVLTDVINELGVRILQQYGEAGNVGNVAFSPTGIGFILAALYEGSVGSGNEQIAHVLGLPRDRDITRIGLRDIHRRLRSYLSPDGFLGGLTLNRENTKLRPEYEEILKFLGFDFSFGNDRSNTTDSSTSLPESTSTLTSPAVSDPPTAPITSTEESKSTVTTRITEGPTTTRLPEETTEATTNVLNEATTIDRNYGEFTTLKSNSDIDRVTTVQKISESPTPTELVKVTEAISTTQETTLFGNTPALTMQSTTIIPEASSKLTEASSTIPTVEERTVPVSTTEPTMGEPFSSLATIVTDNPGVDAMPETTLSVADEAMVTLKTGATTSHPDEPVTVGETTPTTESESSTTVETASTFIPKDESNIGSEVVTTTLSPVESQAELTTTTITNSVPKETVSNEILHDSTTASITTTTTNDIDEVETISDSNSMSGISANLLSVENKTEKNSEISTTPSPVDVNLSERRRVRKIEIRDPVVRALLDAKSANAKGEIVTISDLNNSKERKVVWINRVAEYSFTERNSGDEPTKVDGKHRETRSPSGYFPNSPEFPIFPIHPDISGYPEETAWTRKFGGWRVHSPKTDESSQDVTELTFLVNGEDPTAVPAATYTVVLPFAFLPNVQALALEFPLDDPRYNILLLLPTDRDGTRRLARDLGDVALTEIRKELQPAWVRAMIPSFMLKGFVTLTPFLQRLGIRDVFEPRAADLSPMTEDVGVYARDVQQSIGVNIRNYMKPDRTHSRNGILERAGPVSFVAEHPFLFFIIDAETGVSLITGRIEDPLNSRIL